VKILRSVTVTEIAMAKPMYVMDTSGAQTFVRAMARADGLIVIFHPEKIQPYTDPVRKEIHVTCPQWAWTEEEWLCWQGEILHELGHHRGVNGEIMHEFVERKVNTRSLYGTVINILTDWINDYQWVSFGGGAHNSVETVQRRCAREGLRSVQSDGLPEGNAGVLVRIFSWIYSQRAATYQKGLMMDALGWEKAFPHELDHLNSELRDLLKNPTADKVQALALKLVPPDEQDEQQQEQEVQGEGDPDGDGEEGEGNEAEGSWVSYRDLLMPHNHDTEAAKNSINIKYDHDPRDNYVPFGNTFDEIDVARQL